MFVTLIIIGLMITFSPELYEKLYIQEKYSYWSDHLSEDDRLTRKTFEKYRSFIRAFGLIIVFLGAIIKGGLC